MCEGLQGGQGVRERVLEFSYYNHIDERWLHVLVASAVVHMHEKKGGVVGQMRGLGVHAHQRPSANTTTHKIHRNNTQHTPQQRTVLSALS